MNKQIFPVSLIAAASRCPVRAYFIQSSEWKEPPGYTICKQVSYHLGGPLCFETIWDEITTISPAIGDDNAAFLDSCIERCGAKEWRTASDHDLRVRSEKYGIYGVIDRVFEEPPYFSIVRSVASPPAGVAMPDRVRIAAYALCLSEMYGKEISGGTVEYIPDGNARFCGIQPGDMRRFYAGLRTVRNMKAGSVPKRPAHAPCTSCSFRPRCDPGPKPLSERLHER